MDTETGARWKRRDLSPAPPTARRLASSLPDRDPLAMDFMGIGFQQILLVLLITVIVFGPQRPPELAVQAARAVRYLRGYATAATTQMRAEFEELTREYESPKRELEETKREVREHTKDATRAADRVLEESRSTLEPSRPSRT